MNWVKNIIFVFKLLFVNRKKVVLGFIMSLFFIFTSLEYSNNKVINFAQPFIFNFTKNIDFNEVGLVLGTSKYMRRGGVNPYFKYRMDAAASLYFSNKIKKIIVSGDNHKHGYNEPEQMRDYLIKLGVKEKDITLDFAGFRTFDSMIRAKKIFGLTKLTVISQKFHNELAVFLARKNGIETIGFNAKTPWFSKRMEFREYLAKFKAVLDVYILPTKPRFLGKKEEIN